MSKYYPRMILYVIFIAALSACKKNVALISVEDEKAASLTAKRLFMNSVQTPDDGVISGLNQNWTQFPALNDALMIKNINKLSPEMMRFPGGTLSHRWEWTTGMTSDHRPSEEVHPIGDVKQLIDSTGVKMMLVLDVVNHSCSNQIRMLDSLHSLGVAIEYVEMGNELYASGKGYETPFPTGTAYADTINSWVPRIKAAYPNVKISAILQPRVSSASNTRLYNWNSQVTSGITANINAYTYHIYIADGGTFIQKKSDFESVVINPGNKELWITEYGNMNANTNTNYLSQLDSLANYIESYPRVTVALSHQIFGGAFNKLSADGHTFTAEGNLFLARADVRNSPIPVVFNEIYNSNNANGADDAVELLVVRNHLDMRRMILKNFTNGSTDNGVRYTFANSTFWSNLPKGTLIVLRNGLGSSTADSDPSDGTLNLDINNTTYFTKDTGTSANFDVANGTDMWMIKAPSSGLNGSTSGIHSLFAGSTPTTLYNNVTTPKLRSSTAWAASGASTVYCSNITSGIYDFKDTSGGNAAQGTSATLGSGNNTNNTKYVNQVRLGW
ncbi:glycosyl hydrolase [Pedobacter sp. GSP4]|uniref:glycosyl hydrolase n=1 Tax=Pedobacter sp. GSP4 TaxID=3453716 RepID=UPI003EEE2D78